MWPPPLNLRAGCSATCVVTSPKIQSQMHAVDTKRVDASNYVTVVMTVRMQLKAKVKPQVL